VTLGSLVLLGHFWPSRGAVFLIYLVLFLFFLGSFKLAVRQILFTGEVDGNKIVGSVSLYLLIGLMWTTVYMMLLVFDPHAFNGIETARWQQLFSRVAYYSFVTLTTLGYGDISPASRIAEFFAEMETVTGVFYMAIFVSSLINLQGSKRAK
jgi:voltage-gated potassium channel Kch